MCQLQLFSDRVRKKGGDTIEIEKTVIGLIPERKKLNDSKTVDLKESDLSINSVNLDKGNSSEVFGKLDQIDDITNLMGCTDSNYDINTINSTVDISDNHDPNSPNKHFNTRLKHLNTPSQFTSLVTNSFVSVIASDSDPPNISDFVPLNCSDPPKHENSAEKSLILSIDDTAKSEVEVVSEDTDIDSLKQAVRKANADLSIQQVDPYIKSERKTKMSENKNKNKNKTEQQKLEQQQKQKQQTNNDDDEKCSVVDEKMKSKGQCDENRCLGARPKKINHEGGIKVKVRNTSDDKIPYKKEKIKLKSLRDPSEDTGLDDDDGLKAEEIASKSVKVDVNEKFTASNNELRPKENHSTRVTENLNSPARKIQRGMVNTLRDRFEKLGSTNGNRNTDVDIGIEVKRLTNTASKKRTTPASKRKTTRTKYIKKDSIDPLQSKINQIFRGVRK